MSVSKVFQRTGAVAMGTALGQGLVLLATPFLARIYSPAEFGALAILVTVSNISMTIACLRYDVALPSAAELDVRGLLVTAITSAALLAAASVIVARCLLANHVGFEHADQLIGQPILVGTCVLLVGLFQATNAWFLRRGSFNGVAALRVSQGGTFSALATLPHVGLLWAHAVSFSGGLFGVWKAVRQRSPSDAPWTDVGRRHREFPFYNLPGSLMDVVGYSVSIWVVAATYGHSAAGEYSQIQRIIGAPLMLISISMGQILLKHTAELMHDLRQMRLLLFKLLRVMVALAVMALTFLWMAGLPVIAWILGPRWHVDKETIVLLGLAVFARACVSPLTSALLTLRRFGLTLCWQAAYFCSATILMPWMARTFQFRGYVRFYAVHECAFYAAYLFLLLFATRNEKCAESLAS